MSRTNTNEQVVESIIIEVANRVKVFGDSDKGVARGSFDCDEVVIGDVDVGGDAEARIALLKDFVR